jgi:hypothetical protein
MTRLSSRERMLAAIRYQQPDYVPLIFNVFGFHPPPHLAWSNQVEQAQRWLSLGVDATLGVSLPLMFHPDVGVREWEESVPGERWPLMVKEYHTPAGIMRQEVYRTDDWVSPDWPGHRAEHSSVALFDDYNVARSRRFLIETAEDLEKLKYLLYPLPVDAIARFNEEAAVVAGQAEQLGVLLEGQGSTGVDALIWLFGAEGMVFLAMDQPEMFNALLDIVHDWDKRNVEILLDTPVELVTRRGWYEGTAFWSPALFRRFFQPRFKELTDAVHQADRLMGYRNSTGFMPLLDAFVKIGYDAHFYIDPVMGGAGVDLCKVKSTFNNKIAVIGGVNSAVTLERGSRETIRQEVFEAVETLGPGGGLVLTPVDCISASTPWENIEILIEAWKEVRDYPL